MVLPAFSYSIIVTVALAVGISAPYAEEIEVTSGDRTDLSVTVYNGDLALVRDSRAAKLDSGEVELAFAGVSTRLQPETALLRSLDNAFMVKEQVFDFGVVDRQALLAASVGETIGVVTVNPRNGDETERRATVLSVANGLVLEMDGRILTDPPGRLVFDTLPSGLRTEPTLLAVIDVAADGEVIADLSYLTSGLTWRADYVAELNPDGTALQLSAWATISNVTGTDFPDAQLKLVAGDINRAAPAPQVMMAMERAARTAVMADSVAQESLAAFHLYTIDRPVTLEDQQTKQLALLSAGRVNVRTDVFSQSDGVAIRTALNNQARTAQANRALVFENTEAEGLGTPLPTGTVRVYGQDGEGSLQLLGEDGLAHTPVGQDVRFTLGRDFDITVEREQTDFLRASDRITISAHRLTVSNAKDEDLSVRLVETLQGDWEIIEEDRPHTRSQGNAEWTIDVPAGGEASLTYRVRVRF